MNGLHTIRRINKSKPPPGPTAEDIERHRLQVLKIKSFGIWDPHAEQETAWLRVMQARQWEEWVADPRFRYFPDSPLF